MILQSKPIAIGTEAVVWLLFGKNLQPVEAPVVDVDTEAAFTILRIDALTEGETLVETGHAGVKAIRVRVRNDSDAPAIFRMEIKLGPHYERMQRQIGQVIYEDWRAAYDRAKRGAAN